MYLIAHNVALQEALINRLKKSDQFFGAYYETFVASIFIKAGFALEFEDETDGSSRHCEFTATHIESGKKFSVEAKALHRKNIMSPNQGSEGLNIKIGKLLTNALTKNANYPRIVFIELNLPSSELKSDPIYYARLLRRHEQEIESLNLPLAYVFITNHPYHHDMDATNQMPMFFADGFKIPDFGYKETTLPQAIESRKKHFLINILWESIKSHNTIPSTFNGEIPSFTFGENKQRLIIGEKYIVEDEHGKEKLAELQCATVDKENKKIVATFFAGINQFIISFISMSQEEFEAYAQHPDTFFGVYQEQPKGLNTPMDAFNFLKKSFSSNSKEQLLNKLKLHPEYQNFYQKTKEELLDIYCMAIVPNIFS